MPVPQRHLTDTLHFVAHRIACRFWERAPIPLLLSVRRIPLVFSSSKDLWRVDSDVCRPALVPSSKAYGDGTPLILQPSLQGRRVVSLGFGFVAL